MELRSKIGSTLAISFQRKTKNNPDFFKKIEGILGISFSLLRNLSRCKNTRKASSFSAPSRATLLLPLADVIYTSSFSVRLHDLLCSGSFFSSLFSSVLSMSVLLVDFGYLNPEKK
jgi:hypothetical protein